MQRCFKLAAVRDVFTRSTRQVSGNKYFSKVPLMVETKYPTEMQAWKDIYMEERVAITQNLYKMVDDFVAQDFVTQVPEYLPTYFRELINYNMVGEEYIRGNLAVFFSRMLKGDSISQEELENSRILANLINFGQISLLMADDIFDNEYMRRGRPCWHRKIGLSAINDVNVLVVGHLMLARLYFNKKPYYDKVFNTVAETHIRASMGQAIDLVSYRRRPRNKHDAGIQWNMYSLEYYLYTAFNKAGFYMSFPLNLAFHLCGVDDPETMKKAQEIIYLMGQMDQVVNDWHDWAPWDHDNLDNNKSLASDIRNGKCTWSAVTAWQNANNKQRQRLVKYYGVDELEATDQVVRLFKEIGVVEKHHEYDKRLCDKVFKMIDAWDSKKTGVPKEMFPAGFTCIYGYCGEAKSYFEGKEIIHVEPGPGN